MGIIFDWSGEGEKEESREEEGSGEVHDYFCYLKRGGWGGEWEWECEWDWEGGEVEWSGVKCGLWWRIGNRKRVRSRERLGLYRMVEGGWKLDFIDAAVDSSFCSLFPIWISLSHPFCTTLNFSLYFPLLAPPFHNYSLPTQATSVWPLKWPV